MHKCNFLYKRTNSLLSSPPPTKLKSSSISVCAAEASSKIPVFRWPARPRRPGPDLWALSALSHILHSSQRNLSVQRMYLVPSVGPLWMPPPSKPPPSSSSFGSQEDQGQAASVQELVLVFRAYLSTSCPCSQHGAPALTCASSRDHLYSLQRLH